MDIFKIPGIAFRKSKDNKLYKEGVVIKAYDVFVVRQLYEVALVEMFGEDYIAERDVAIAIIDTVVETANRFNLGLNEQYMFDSLFEIWNNERMVNNGN